VHFLCIRAHHSGSDVLQVSRLPGSSTRQHVTCATSHQATSTTIIASYLQLFASITTAPACSVLLSCGSSNLHAHLADAVSFTQLTLQSTRDALQCSSVESPRKRLEPHLASINYDLELSSISFRVILHISTSRSATVRNAPPTSCLPLTFLAQAPSSFISIIPNLGSEPSKDVESL
jgi:hypothetical protein